MKSILQKKFYFVRHGQTDWNKKKICQGHTDIELNMQGRLEAMRLADYLKNYPLSKIYTSPLKRALETAELIHTQISHCTLHLLDELKERSWGSLEGKPSPKMYEFEEKEQDDATLVTLTGAESMDHLKLRIVRGMNIALQACEVPLIISHGRFFTVLCELLGILPVHQLPNATLVELLPSESQWKLEIHKMPEFEKTL